MAVITILSSFTFAVEVITVAAFAISLYPLLKPLIRFRIYLR